MLHTSAAFTRCHARWHWHREHFGFRFSHCAPHGCFIIFFSTLLLFSRQNKTKRIEYTISVPLAALTKRIRVGSVSDIFVRFARRRYRRLKNIYVSEDSLLFGFVNSMGRRNDTRGIGKNGSIVGIGEIQFCLFASSMWQFMMSSLKMMNFSILKSHSGRFSSTWNFSLLSLLAWGSVSFRGLVQLNLMAVILATHVSTARSIKIQLCYFRAKELISTEWEKTYFEYVHVNTKIIIFFIHSARLLSTQHHQNSEKRKERKRRRDENTMMMFAPVLFRFSIDSCFSLKT